MIVLPIGVLLQATCVTRKAILGVFEVQGYTIFSFGGYPGMEPFARLPPPPSKKAAGTANTKTGASLWRPPSANE